jgi:peroxiredoxin
LAEANAGETTMPVVALSTAHAGISQIKVGDQFPNLELADLSGAAQKLSSLRGQKLTVVVFWKSAHPTSVEELADLERDTLKRFGQNGVAVVAINSGDPATVAADLAKQAQVTYPVLLDADGAALQRVATQKLPRTYLLNVQGKVVWFDLEYSATTRRDLSQAIRYSLAH